MKSKRLTGKCIKCSKRTQGRFNNLFCCRICKHKQIFEATITSLSNLSDFDFGWLVGMIEGEGCFYCKGSKSALRNESVLYPLCGFSLMSTDEDVMIRVSKLLDIQIKGPYYKSKSVERKVVWSVQVTGNKAVAIMEVLYSHLSIRRQEQIDKAMEWQSGGRFKI